MEKQEIQNKAFKGDLKDKSEGVVVSEEVKKEKVSKKGFIWRNKTYLSLSEIPVPLSQARTWLASGAIKEV